MLHIFSQTELYCVHSRGLWENRTLGTSVTGMYVSHYTNRPFWGWEPLCCSVFNRLALCDTFLSQGNNTLVAGTGFEPVSSGYEPNGVTTPPTRDVYRVWDSNPCSSPWKGDVLNRFTNATFIHFKTVEVQLVYDVVHFSIFRFQRPFVVFCLTNLLILFCSDKWFVFFFL